MRSFPAWSANAGSVRSALQIQSALSQLDNPQGRVVSRSTYINAQNFRTRRDPLRLSRTAGESTQQTATLHEIPEMPPDVVAALLKTTPFKSVMNQPWMQGLGGGEPGWAPTTRSRFSIVPQNYFAGFIPMTQNGCMKCHDSAGRHVDNFDPHPSQMFAPSPRDAQRPRTWYNFIPGNNGILSFHPFSANAVARGAGADRGSLNDCLVRNGLIQ